MNALRELDSGPDGLRIARVMAYTCAALDERGVLHAEGRPLLAECELENGAMLGIWFSSVLNLAVWCAEMRPPTLIVIAGEGEDEALLYDTIYTTDAQAQMH